MSHAGSWIIANASVNAYGDMTVCLMMYPGSYVKGYLVAKQLGIRIV
jgi:hypothetical protein